MRALAISAVLLLCAAAVLGKWSWPHRDIEDEAEHKVKFELYTRDNDADPEVVTASELPASLDFFQDGRPTKILVHGWHGSKKHTITLMRALLQVADLNVFLINWHEVDTLYYPGAVKRVTTVARQLAALVDFLTDVHGMNPEHLHIVGHSLGAHISGLSAVFVTSNITIGRITGLDPAGPLFKDGREHRLDKSHAAFVDVMHTCGNVFGYRDPVGHVDFYPNGGMCIQPGCLVKDLTTGKCSHNRAYSLFLESVVLGDTLLAVPAKVHSPESPCEEVDAEAEMMPMGLGTPASARGVYCLPTRSKEPFGYGEGVPAIVPHKLSSLQARIIKSLFLKTTSLS